MPPTMIDLPLLLASWFLGLLTLVAWFLTGVA
jgi:hypothetical protein